MIRLRNPAFLRHRLLRTAGFRLAGLYAALFAVSAIILGASAFLAARSAVQHQMKGRIQTETSFVRAEFKAGGLPRLLTVVGLRGRGRSALDYLVEDSDGRHLAGEMPASKSLQPGWTLIDNPSAAEDGGRPERVRALVTGLPGGITLAVGEDVRRLAQVEEAIASAFLWSLGLVALLGIGGGILLSRAFLKRVDAIARTAEAIIAGDLARRIPIRGTGDHLDRLAGTLNQMLDRIAALMDSLRQVSSDVAHDLRAPLTRLYQRLEHARTRARSAGEIEAAIDAAVHEAEGLLETFSALLRIAQVEGTAPRSGFRDVDLSAVADAVADAYRPDAEEAGHVLTAMIDPAIVVHGDQELLTQALANLLDNALRHTLHGARINLGLSRLEDGQARLVVEDDGPGVPSSEIPHLVDRFYRSERSRTTPGNGLGLSLVAAVADLHAAHLFVEDAAPGLRARLDFPPPPLLSGADHERSFQQT